MGFSFEGRVYCWPFGYCSCPLRPKSLREAGWRVLRTANRRRIRVRWMVRMLLSGVSNEGNIWQYRYIGPNRYLWANHRNRTKYWARSFLDIGRGNLGWRYRHCCSTCLVRGFCCCLIGYLPVSALTWASASSLVSTLIPYCFIFLFFPKTQHSIHSDLLWFRTRLQCPNSTFRRMCRFSVTYCCLVMMRNCITVLKGLLGKNTN